MRRRYEVKVRGEFAAAHLLRGYAGACDRVHGHTFKVEAEVTAEAVDGLGMGLDFHELEGLLQGALAPLDHRMLNELPAFAEVNPTAERIAEHVMGRLRAALEDRPGGAGGLRVSAVTVAENDRFSVRVSELPPSPSRPQDAPEAASEAASGRPGSGDAAG